jgi:outer membrane protein OmpA-like peptidoglycan-associated protein
MRKAITLFSILFLCAFGAFAQQPDAEGCKDHPSFNRMPGFYITECTHNFDLVEMWISGEQSVKVEGNKTQIVYSFDTEKGQPPSFYQLTKNFENAIAKYGGVRKYLGSQESTLYYKNAGKEVWIQLYSASDVAEGYTLVVVEVEAMKQEIVASEILEALNNTGSIALYINFDTGKATIKPESQTIIDQVALMLTENPTMNISVEGHTDNVGNAATNQTLSENRAAAVKNALIAKGIDKTRLSSKGWGQTKPIADNGTDDGKAKNRRVEIVKK